MCWLCGCGIAVWFFSAVVLLVLLAVAPEEDYPGQYGPHEDDDYYRF